MAIKKVRWGVLSTAKIGLQKVIPAMQKGQYSQVEGIASRDGRVAAQAAASLGIPKSYGSYEELLKDPEIDAVYIPLPNHLHVIWIEKCLMAGKHVLCEKPIGLDTSDVNRLLAICEDYPHLKVMEAFMYRFHPQWIEAKNLVKKGEIGELLTIQSVFSYYNTDPANIRNDPSYGGGGLLDIGCYCISLSRFILDREPDSVSGVVEMDPVFAVDRKASAMMQFGAVTSTFTCATQMAPYQRVHLIGDKGRIEIEIPYNAPPDVPCRVFLEKNKQVKEIHIEIVDQYTLQGDAFSLAVLKNLSVPTSLEDALNNMRVIDAVFKSGKTRSWEAP